MFSAARTICHDHVSCTSFRVGRVTAGVADCANCYRVDTIRVAIKIALVFMPSKRKRIQTLFLVVNCCLLKKLS